MDFIRPEIRHFTWRYSDALIGVAVSLLGLGWALSSVGFMVTLGYAVTIAGALLIFAGIQRGRFKADPNGVGIVTIDEGQVTYFGPFGGGSVHVNDLIQVDIDRSQPDEPAWLILAQGADPLRVPMNAIGADILFDVFNGLDGMRTNRLLNAVERETGEHVIVWRQNAMALD